MAQLTYHRGLRLKSGTKATYDAEENPWLDDQTTAHYPVATYTQPQPSQPLPRVAALPSPPSASGVLVRAPRPAATKQRVDAAIESFWKEQTSARRARVMSRVFDPTWVRVLAALVGVAMCATFGWLLVAGSELPSFAPRAQTLVPSIAVTATESLPPALSAETAPLMAAISAAAASSNELTPLDEPAAKGAAKRSSRAKREHSDKPKTRARAQVAAASSGLPATLRINSRPWSEVFIDNKSVGPTPQLSISLEPGVHNVRLHNRQLNLLKILTLHVLPGQTIDRVEMLEP